MSYKAKVNDIDSMIRSAQAEIKKITKEARTAKDPALFERENRAAVIGKLEKTIQAELIEVKTLLLADMLAAKTAEKDLRKNMRISPAERAMHSNRSGRHISTAKSPEEARQIFCRLVGGLSGDDKIHAVEYRQELVEYHHRHAPHEMPFCDQVIYSTMDTTEKQAAQKARIAGHLFKQNEVINNLVLQQVEDLKNDGSCTAYDWNAVIDTTINQALGKPKNETQPEIEAALQELQTTLRGEGNDSKPGDAVVSDQPL